MKGRSGSGISRQNNESFMRQPGINNYTGHIEDKQRTQRTYKGTIQGIHRECKGFRVEALDRKALDQRVWIQIPTPDSGAKFKG